MATACVVVLAPNFLRALTTCISMVATLTFSVLASTSCRRPRASRPRHSISRAVSGLPVRGLLFKVGAFANHDDPSLIACSRSVGVNRLVELGKNFAVLGRLAKRRGRISALCYNTHGYALQGQNGN